MTISILPILQIIISALLITGILLQQRGSALGSAFGQGGGASFGVRRGAEKKIYWATVILGALFIVVSILNIIF